MNDGELTPKEKALRQRIASLAGQVGANRRLLSPGYDGKEATRSATEAYWSKLESECDPDGVLSPSARRNKAKKLWRARMAEGRLRRAQALLHGNGNGKEGCTNGKRELP